MLMMYGELAEDVCRSCVEDVCRSRVEDVCRSRVEDVCRISAGVGCYGLLV